MKSFRHTVLVGIALMFLGILAGMVGGEPVFLIAFMGSFALLVVCFLWVLFRSFIKNKSDSWGAHFRGIVNDWAAWLAFLLFLGVMLAVLPGSAREAARRTQCRNNLKQLALAIHNYAERYDCLPPAYTVDDQGKPMHSWRALILPFIEGTNAGYNYDEPWDSPDNLAFAKSFSCDGIFSCPSEYRDENEEHNTSYVMLVGPNAFGDGANCRKFADIRDGTSNTIMLCEMAHSGILWTEPRDLDVSVMSYRLNYPHQIGLRSEHAGGLYVSFADGSTRFLGDQMNEDIVKALTTIDGGEKVDEW